MAPIVETVQALWYRPRLLGHPIQDYTLALHILEHDTSISTSYLCSWVKILHQHSCDNHMSIGAHGPTVLAKVISGAVNNFLLIFPQWILQLIYGLLLIELIPREGKRRIMVDPFTRIHNADNTDTLHDNMERSYPEQG